MTLFNNISNSIQRTKTIIKHFSFFKVYLRMVSFERLNSFLSSYFGGKARFLPKEIIIRVTEKCFLNCKMCGQRGNSGKFINTDLDPNAIDTKLIYKLIDEVATWRLKPLIKFTGGEPMLLKGNLIDLIRYIKQKGLICRLSTNGVMLRNEHYAEELVKMGLDTVCISIDGSKELHNKIRGNIHAFDYSIQGIKNLIKFKKKYKTKNPLILMTSVISTLNQDQMLNVIKLADELEVDWMNFQFFNYTTKETTEESGKIIQSIYNIPEKPWQYFSNEEFAKVNIDLLYQQIVTMKSKNYKFPVNFLGIGSPTKKKLKDYYYDIKKPIKKRLCYKPYTSVAFVPPGRLAFCIDYPFYFYGNIKDSSIKEIWFSKKAQEFRKKHAIYYKKNKTNFPHCMRCNWRFN